MSKSVEQAYARIREGILSGTFKPGQRLIESDLVAFCGVSRTPVRTAISRLTAEEFLESERNQGARVKVWDHRDVNELFDLRALLEGYAAASAAQHISTDQLGTIEAAIEEMDAILEQPQSSADPTQLNSEFLRLNRIVHSTIWEAANNARLVATLSRLVEQSLQVRTVRAFTPARLGESHHHHQELLRALKARDGLWAEATMRSHIRAARDSLIADAS